MCSQLIKGKVGRELSRSAALIAAGHCLNVPPVSFSVPSGDIIMMRVRDREREETMGWEKKEEMKQ